MNQQNLLASTAFTPISLQAPDAWVGHLPFAAWLIKETTPGIFVELGTHTGNSYFSFCQSVVENDLPTKCYAVDTWQGDEHAGQYEEDIFAKVNAHHQQHYTKFSRLLRMTFDDALSYFADASVDLLHIDGLHTYEAVRHDFESWLPKLAPGAIVLFHDTNVRERNFGVWRLWSELKTRYPNHLEFVHSHGLGVLQLNDAPNGKQLDCLRLPAAEKQAFIRFFASLGAYHLDRFALTESKRQIQNLSHYASNLERTIAEQQHQLASLNEKTANLEEKNSDLIAERNYALNNFFAIRNSSSWKLTVPIRFLGHLLKGDFELAGNVIREAIRRTMLLIPRSLQNLIGRNYGRLLSILGVMPNSNANLPAIAAIIEQRQLLTRQDLTIDPLNPPLPLAWAEIDISIVTFNSSRWVNGFVESLMALNYPKQLLSLRFVDNGSTDSTVEDLSKHVSDLRAAGFEVEILQRPNHGFGAGHNHAISKGNAPFCLVTNIDLTFEADALGRVVAVALNDDENIATWELRQKPYEHPKLYDPVTGLTNWNSHACILLRRSALDRAGSYDETLFMYGEDVELSYRLRRAGFLLRYCPSAVVWHYSYESANQVKPMQFLGSTFANLYLRLKYGNKIDMLSVPLLSLRLLLAPEAFPGSRQAVARNLLKLATTLPGILANRRPSSIHFPFRTWDYELTREGDFIEQLALPAEPPLVSIVTRTYAGREPYLRQALLSVAHQTYPNIEHIVVEDGGETMRAVVGNLSQVTGKTIKFIALDKLGRSATGNAGLAAAQGKWCLFLDDDDLLFAEHIETLVNALLADPDSVAAYSLAWEVVTDGFPLYSEISHVVPRPFLQDFDYATLQHHNFMAIQSVLFERRLYLERGGFEVDMEALEDWVLWKKYAYNHKFTYVPKVTSLFRTPADPEKINQRIKCLDFAYPLALARNSEHRLAIESATPSTLNQMPTHEWQ